MVAPVEETGELEMDGVWHKWAEPVQVKGSPLGPDKELDGIVVIPDNQWLRTTPVRGESRQTHISVRGGRATRSIQRGPGDSGHQQSHRSRVSGAAAAGHRGKCGSLVQRPCGG